ncbi:MAG: hypothetical protein RLW68_10535 [Devosia marina]|uniref:hypothetical protein n=1 Tax=Devosia marina TaxID=2683198 RepID=UPI0032EEF6B0
MLVDQPDQLARPGVVLREIHNQMLLDDVDDLRTLIVVQPSKSWLPSGEEIDARFGGTKLGVDRPLARGKTA